VLDLNLLHGEKQKQGRSLEVCGYTVYPRVGYGSGRRFTGRVGYTDIQ